MNENYRKHYSISHYDRIFMHIPVAFFCNSQPQYVLHLLEGEHPADLHATWRGLQSSTPHTTQNLSDFVVALSFLFPLHLKMSITLKVLFAFL